MKLIKKGHACVRLEKDGQVLVIDPGSFSEPDAAVGADAVLITHEHPDHFAEDRLRAALESNPAAHVWTLRSVAGHLAAAFPGRVTTVGDGDAFTAAGFAVRAHGELHAVIHPDLPRITNVGFLVGEGDDAVFHPGDAFTLPGSPVDTLLLPLHAPWSKFSEVADYVREVAPRQAYAVHDGLLNDAGLGVYDRNLGPAGPGIGGTAYRRLTPGESVGGA